MSVGRSIRLFLVDGVANGLITAEIVNWTGHTITAPRSRLAELLQREECSRTGIYFLVGPDPENPFRPQVYVGESDNISQRLKQHNRPEDQGGKDFWERVFLVTSKDENLTKAHVKYLESQFITLAKTSTACTLMNSTAPDYTGLPESDVSDMAFFTEQIQTLLPVLGFDFLRKIPRQNKSNSFSEQTQDVAYFEMRIPKYGIIASAQEIDGEIVVQQGSLARNEWIGIQHGYKILRQQLIDDGVLMANGKGQKYFTKNYAFSSPSAAAAVIAGRSTNGRLDWIEQSTQRPYGEWQSNKIENETQKP